MNGIQIQQVAIAITTAGFRLSDTAIMTIAIRKGLEPVEAVGSNRLIGWGDPDVPNSEVMYWNVERTDPDLISTIRDLGPEAGLPGVVFRIFNAPEGLWEIRSIELPSGAFVESISGAIK